MPADQRSDIISAVREGIIAKVNTLIIEFGLSNPKIIEDLLKYGSDVNSLLSDKNGCTLLHQAATINQFDVAILLINHGADVNAKNKDGRLPIFYAVKNNNVNMTRLLLSSGTELKYCPDLLHLAVRKLSKELFYMILSMSDLDVDAIDDELERTALHWTVIPKDVSCGSGNESVASNVDIECKMATAILSRGANVNARCKNGQTVLHNAAYCGHIGIVEILLKHKADVNCRDKSELTPLHYSARKGNEEIMTMLLNNGARVSNKDIYGNTALHYACNSGHKTMVATLIEFGADIDSSDNAHSLMYSAINYGHTGVLEILLKHDVNVNCMYRDTQTPLNLSVDRGHETITRMLLNNGARINVKERFGDTALNIACMNSNEEIVAMLLDFGADFDTTGERSSSPLQNGALCGNLAIVRNLLKFFADIEHRDEYGKTALHIAVEHGRPDVTRELLEHGSDINVTCNEGLTPYDYVPYGIEAYNNRRGDEIPYRNVYDHGFHYNDDDRGFRYNDYDNGFHYNDDDCDNIGYIADHSDTLTEVLKQHILKIKALNMYVRPIDLELTDIENVDKYFYEDCKLEVQRSKDEKISDTNATFNDLMTKDIDQLAIYARNPSIVETLKTGEWKKKFPIYGNMMYNHFKKGERRRSLLNPSTTTLNFLLGFVLPEYLSAKVLMQLSNKELVNLIKAGSLQC